MVHAQGARIRVRGLQPAQVLAGLAGIAFLVVGIIGLARTGFGNFAGHHEAWFWRFSGNPLMSVVRIVAGVVGLLLAFGSGRARLFGWLLFLGGGALFVWGLMIHGLVAGNPVANAGNPLDLGRPDTWLHLGVAALGLLIAVLPARRKVLVPEEEVPPATAPMAAASDRGSDRVPEASDRASDRASAEPEPAGRRSFLHRKEGATEAQPRAGFWHRKGSSGDGGHREGLAH